MSVDLRLDCRGQKCPLPVIRLAQSIGSVPIGGSVEVATEDPAARPDIAAWCRMKAHEYVGEATASDGVPIYRVRRLN